jgi:hypothetical protein
MVGSPSNAAPDERAQSIPPGRRIPLPGEERASLFLETTGGYAIQSHSRAVSAARPPTSARAPSHILERSHAGMT